MGNPEFSRSTGISAGERSVKRHSGLLVGYLLLTVALLIIAIGALAIVPSFAPVFKPLGDLPWITTLVVSSGAYWGVFPVISAIISGYLWRRASLPSEHEKVLRFVLIVSAVFAVAIVPIGLYALYLPMFKLGGA